MNIPKSITVELLPCYRTRTSQKPTFWEYTREWNKRRPMWTLEGAYFFQGPGQTFRAAVRQMQADNPHFCVKNLDDVFTQFQVNDSFYAPYNFVITPDGQLFVLTGGSVFYRTTFSYKGYPAFRYLTDRHDEPNDKLRHPSWAQTAELLELLETKLFPEAFKVARKEWITQMKASGAWDASIQRAKAKKQVVKTNRKIKVCLQANKAIDEIQQYIKDINNDTATQRQVGELYNTLIELTSLNKKLKTSFPKE